MNEVQYQRKLIHTIERMFPECMIVRADPRVRQGYPDILILFKGFWAALEVKISERASIRPNQDYYINKLGKMSFAAFINPENERAVLDALQSALRAKRQARVSQSK